MEDFLEFEGKTEGKREREREGERGVHVRKRVEN